MDRGQQAPSTADDEAEGRLRLFAVPRPYPIRTRADTHLIHRANYPIFTEGLKTQHGSEDDLPWADDEANTTNFNSFKTVNPRIASCIGKV